MLTTEIMILWICVSIGLTHLMSFSRHILHSIKIFHLNSSIKIFSIYKITDLHIMKRLSIYFSKCMNGIGCFTRETIIKCMVSTFDTQANHNIIQLWEWMWHYNLSLNAFLCFWCILSQKKKKKQVCLRRNVKKSYAKCTFFKRNMLIWNAVFLFFYCIFDPLSVFFFFF